ncbi:phospholipid carrier-dependent glycosyltransferase [soil metagenome]
MTALSENRQNAITIALLALMLTSFVVLSYGSVRTKSATADEPLHALAGFMRIHYGDFRIDAEDPPLFSYWAMLPHPGDAINIDLRSPAWNYMIEYPWSQWNFVGPTMYRTAGLDPDAFLNRSRAMMTALGVFLGILIAWWACDLGGRVAGLIACGLYCFDPNFLAHAPLVKNDVSLALVMCALMFAVYRAGERVTIGRAVAIALLCAAGLTVKFSGTLLVPMVIVLLFARGLIPRPWLVLGRIVTARSTQFAVALSVILFAAVVSYAGIWAAYGFRYSITPDPAVRANIPVILRAAARNQLLVEQPDVSLDDAAIAERAAHPSLKLRAVLWINDHHLLPEAWTSGLLETYATTIRRPGFLLGDHRTTGWWYYFPLAFAFKTPLATLATLALALVVKRGRRFDRWTICCLAVPIAIYGASALTARLNLGVRHILPIVPFLFIWASVTIANARTVLPRFIVASLAILGAGLMVESIAAAPNYIAYFNVAAGGSRGGFKLLGDSNLDWGQDLFLLRQWQHENPDAELILDYFGGCEPAYYVRHTVLIDQTKPEIAPAPAALGRDASLHRQVLAVSASKLQGIYPPNALRPFYDFIARHTPFKVLGGTIYLYELPLRE